MTADHNAAAREIINSLWPTLPDPSVDALLIDLNAIVDRARQEGRRAGLEEAAKVVEATPTTILQFWDRPGGPPGNGYRATTGADFAAAIRALATGKDRG
jgi:hypothetical protein